MQQFTTFKSLSPPPFLQIGLRKLTATLSGDKFSSLFKTVFLFVCLHFFLCFILFFYISIFFLNLDAQSPVLPHRIKVFFFIFTCLCLFNVHPSRGLRTRGSGGESDTREGKWEEVSWGVLNVIVEKHLVHTTTINFNI